MIDEIMIVIVELFIKLLLTTPVFLIGHGFKNWWSGYVTGVIIAAIMLA